MSLITTHVLDIARGRPAAGIAVVLDVRDKRSGVWRTLGQGITDADGRLRNLLAAKHRLVAGVYRLSFEVGPYFRAAGVECFYPSIAITFEVRAPSEHHHVPLLVSPFGYSTYRGS
jgi:5-hydroxyisourate hydrolase